jgi:hypothetical protein
LLSLPRRAFAHRPRFDFAPASFARRALEVALLARSTGGRAAIAARLATPEGRAEHAQATSDGIDAVRAQHAIAAGFDPNAWSDNILPRLAAVPLKDIARVTGISVQSASRIRRGVRVPHPRHWAALRALVDDR